MGNILDKKGHGWRGPGNKANSGAPHPDDMMPSHEDYTHKPILSKPGKNLVVNLTGAQQAPSGPPPSKAQAKKK